MAIIFSEQVINAFISSVSNALEELTAALDFAAPGDWRKWQTEDEALNSTCSQTLKKIWMIRKNLLDSCMASQIIGYVTACSDCDSEKLRQIIEHNTASPA